MPNYKVSINPAIRTAYVSLTTELNPAGSAMVGQIVFDGPSPKFSRASEETLKTLARALLASKRVSRSPSLVILITNAAFVLEESGFEEGYNTGLQDTIASYLPALKGDKGDPGDFPDIMSLQTAN